MSSSSKTQMQTESLDQAMLGLLRVGTPLQADEETLFGQLEPTGQQEADELEQSIMDQHPGLTLEELREMMEMLGF